MAEGDTILRAGRRIEGALGGEELAVSAHDPRGRAAGVERLDGRLLERVETRGKHLLLHLEGMTLHSHLGMSGSWQVGRLGARWRKSPSQAWVVLKGKEHEAVQFGGSTLRVLTEARLRIDPILSRLGPDILSPDFDSSAAIRSLRAAADLELGEALLDQRLIAGVGNIFKSETCFAAKADPWRPVGEHTDDELQEILAGARHLMQQSVDRGRPDPAVYHLAGRPCPNCGTAIAARGQGDANRRTYWCRRCQPTRRNACASSKTGT